MHQLAVAEQLVPLISSGLVATCAPLDFEALLSTRSLEEYERVRADRAVAYFDTIARITRQDVAWTVARGEVP